MEVKELPCTLEGCLVLDEIDPLRDLRQRFALPEGLVYLDGNSLGPLPVGLAQKVSRVIEEEWGMNLIRGWNENDWLGRQVTAGNKIARLIGAEDGQVMCTDSTSVNLFKALGAAVQLRPGRTVIVSEKGNPRPQS